MERLQKEQIKKGQTIYEIKAWNFLGNGIERREQHHRDEKGRSVYTPHTVDVYSVHAWTVHSIGKKVMRLQDADGMKRAAVYIEYYDAVTFGLNYAATKEQADAVVKYRHENDKYAVAEFQIIDRACHR